jgi:hypothetical protein
MKYLYIALIILTNLKITIAQDMAVPVLEREITVHINNEPLPVALITISQTGNFVFSYSPDAIDVNKKVSLNVNRKPVRHILNQLFEGRVTYKARGRYIILQPGKDIKNEQFIEGYVYDSGSGKKLIETTVYDKDLLISAVTDKYGYFKLELPANKPGSALRVSKEGYADTLLKPLPGKANYVDIELSLKTHDTELTMTPSTEDQINSSRWFISKKLKINARNLTDSVFRQVQLSFVPMISTNKLLTGSAVNNVSINVLVGYVQSVRFLEVGGILNNVRNDASYCQLAGVGNIVGGNFKGLQLAGVYNIEKDIKGLQAAGVINIVRGNAGVCQLAGAGNFTKGYFHGLQAAGAFNFAKEDSGYQIAGAINMSGKVKGLQIAGALNIAKEISGVQISGCLNLASYFNGLQLSVINIADSCQGIPIGLLSYVKHGYHKIEFSGDEVFYTNLAFRTGVKRFHTIILAGIRPDNFETPLWTFGYGAGTTFGKSDKLLFDIDLTSQQVVKGDNFIENQIYKIYAGIDKKIGSKTSIALGVTYNIYMADTKTTQYNRYYSDIIPYHLSNSTFSNGFNLKTWPGLKLAVRFL